LSDDHEVTIEVDCAYVDQSVAGGNPSQIPKSQWLKAKKRWTTTVMAPVKVSGAEEK
jgi:hypothetical protein